jgi:hypothetical protein
MFPPHRHMSPLAQIISVALLAVFVGVPIFVWPVIGKNTADQAGSDQPARRQGRLRTDRERRGCRVEVPVTRHLPRRPFAPRIMAWGIIVSLLRGLRRYQTTFDRSRSQKQPIMVWNGAGRWINVGNRSEPPSIT